jgi:riboflavin biosynthesis pyrimidine reductase
MNSAAEVTERLIRIYGEEPTAPATVLHVTAVWEDEAGDLRALRICDETPVSATDAFVLGVARARAHVIVTTGASLRAEPGLHHGLDGLRRPGEALAAWRRERLGISEPPASCILTASGDIDLGHRLFARSPRTLIYTRPQAADRLRDGVRDAGLETVEIVTDDNSSLAAAIEYLRNSEGFATVGVEAGPSAAATLYAQPGRNACLVDELMLSRYEAGPPSDAVRGPALFEAGRLERLFSRSSTPHAGDEENGTWTFRRFVR